MKFVVPIAIGLCGGFAFLHPLSITIIDAFEQAQFSVTHILLGAFGGVHLTMGVFFSILGGFIGLLFSFYTHRLEKTTMELVSINESIGLRNAILFKDANRANPKISAIVKQMRPNLDKIMKLVDLVTAGNAGSINSRQSSILSITKGNIDHLFYVIDYLVSLLEKDDREEVRECGKIGPTRENPL